MSAPTWLLSLLPMVRGLLLGTCAVLLYLAANARSSVNSPSSGH